MSTPEKFPVRPTYVRRPGDRVVRRAVFESETVRLRPPKAHKKTRNPAIFLVTGFAGLILIGTLLLMLPWVSADGESVGFVNALFTSTSAVCVTGLVVLDTATAWSSLGHVIILVLIQLGGFGFMTSSTLLLLLLLGKRASLQQRLLLGQSMGGGAPGQVLTLIRRIALMTIGIEAIGATILFPRMLQEMPTGEALWWSIFHSISAFNNAGFDLVGDFQSLVPYHFDTWILSIIGILAILGGISYTVMADMVRTRGTWRKLAVDTKLVLSTTVALLVVGAIFLLAVESRNPDTLGSMSWYDRVQNAIFYSTTPRTSGFTVLPINDLNDETSFMTMAMMFIGGASGSTAGGIKIQTFTLLFFAILAAVAGRDQVVAFGREIPAGLVFRALTIALLSIAAVFGVALLLTITEEFRFLEILFETVSAYGTVGLSTGITPHLTDISKIILAITMLVGRLGPLTLVLALAVRGSPHHTVRYAPESVKIG